MTRSEALYILGLKPGASVEEAREAWRNLVKLTHPDKDRSHDAAERFQKVQTAYQTIIATEAVAREEKREREVRKEQAAQHAREEYARRQRVEQHARYAQAARQNTSQRQPIDFKFVWYILLFAGVCFLFSFLRSHTTASKERELIRDYLAVHKGSYDKARRLSELVVGLTPAEANLICSEVIARQIVAPIAEELGENADIEQIRAELTRRANTAHAADIERGVTTQDEIDDMVDQIIQQLKVRKGGDAENEHVNVLEDPDWKEYIDRNIAVIKKENPEVEYIKSEMRKFMEGLDPKFEVTDEDISSVMDYIDTMGGE